MNLFIDLYYSKWHFWFANFQFWITFDNNTRWDNHSILFTNVVQYLYFMWLLMQILLYILSSWFDTLLSVRKFCVFGTNLQIISTRKVRLGNDCECDAIHIFQVFLHTGCLFWFSLFIRITHMLFWFAKIQFLYQIQNDWFREISEPEIDFRKSIGSK